MYISNSSTVEHIDALLDKNESSSKLYQNNNDKVFFKGSRYGENIIVNNKNFDFESLKSLINLIDYGIIIISIKDKVIILNDRYGAYPLFLYSSENKNILVDNLNLLDKNILTDYDPLGFVDFFLFHHTIGENTLHKNVIRVPGNSVISINNNGDVQIDQNNTSANYSISEISDVEALNKHIVNSSHNSNTFLTLTGGFDSRLLLSILLNQNKKIEATTWGVKGNFEAKLAKDLAKSFSLDHFEVNFGDKFVDSLPSYIDMIFKLTPDSPFILDTPHYIYFSEELGSLHGNIDLITGILGSELLRGPTYSSEIFLTKFVADLYRTKDYNDLKTLIENKLNDSNFFEKDFIVENIDLLTNRYLPLSSVETKKFNNKGQINYLLNEKYGKLFSQITRLYHPSINVINPYLNVDFVNNQIERFLKDKELYLNSKFDNYKSYKYYASLIKESYPELLNTKVDKGGYYLKDLLSPLGIFRVLISKYIRNTKSTRTKRYNPVFDYYKWYKPLVETSYDSKAFNYLSVFNYENINLKAKNKYEQQSQLDKNSLIIIAGLHMFDKYLKSNN